MSSNQVPPPRLPEAPEEYSASYMSDLVRALEIFIEQERNPGGIRASTATLTGLPTSASGLEVGSLHNDSGTVRIVT